MKHLKPTFTSGVVDQNEDLHDEMKDSILNRHFLRPKLIYRTIYCDVLPSRFVVFPFIIRIPGIELVLHSYEQLTLDQLQTNSPRQSSIRVFVSKIPISMLGGPCRKMKLLFDIMENVCEMWMT